MFLLILYLELHVTPGSNLPKEEAYEKSQCLQPGILVNLVQ